ncbi:discoidin domain-containing protein [Luteolibacter pohnpeiensis]|uniref:Discoidin domain-containing protein n=1 Tax=Luteolibacter pohnpeiensis TaxID=454153 RepID=A0A934S1L2_9BACT|nr:discoidin domain-containing protein [Luteolibacter pohnpeiensis]MBK1881560.1 discoidin domain-containing protein [Luteolibacter pohnpeiensis]
MKPKLKLNGRFRAISAIAAVITTTVCFTASAQALSEVTYQYYRFTTTAANGGDGNYEQQLSEIAFYNHGVRLNLNGNLTSGDAVPVTVTEQGVDPVEDDAEGPMNLVDGLLTTKWYSGGAPEDTPTAYTPLVFAFEAPVTISSYDFASANDYMYRHPRSWTLEGSSDGVNYTVIDTRTDVAPVSRDSYFAYQGGFDIPSSSGLTFDYFDCYPDPAIVAAGDTSSLGWGILGDTSTGGAPTSITLMPGNIDLTSLSQTTTSGTQTTTYGYIDLTSIDPSGTYTIVASNANGTVYQDFSYRVVDGSSVTCQYVRFTPLAFRGTPNSIQLSEFEFYNGDTLVPVTSVTNPNGNTPAAEGVANVIDGDYSTKWLDFNKGGLVFNLGSSQTFDSYQFVTANDAIARDPVQWQMEISNDGTTWTVLDYVGSGGFVYPTPEARNTATGKIKFPDPTASTSTPIVWEGTGETAPWDTFDVAYTDGATVLFDDTSEATAINVDASVAPGEIIFNNSSKDYSLQGSGLYGSANLVKNGSGILSLDSDNYLSGSVQVNAGTLSVNSGLAFGDPLSPGTLYMGAGTTLEIQSTVATNRVLSLTDATVDVPTDVSFYHYGKLILDGTFTKTGPGLMKLSGYGGSTTSGADSHEIVVEDGVLDFSTDMFNQTVFNTRFFATARGSGVLRASAYSGFGGDYIEYVPTIGQLRAEDGGTIEVTSAIQYFPVGTVTNDEGVAQGRVVLRGANLVLTGQTETSRADGTAADGTDATRTVISTEASDVTSKITGLYVVNRQHAVFDVADGPVGYDLEVDALVAGAYGIIKEGDGEMLFLYPNSYQGKTTTYVQSIDNPTNDANFDQTNVTAKAFDLAQGTVIRGGLLTVANLEGSGTGDSPVLVESGGTLGGTGYVAGTVEIDGSVAPGDPSYGLPYGALSVGSTVLTGTYKWEVNGTGQPEAGLGLETGADLLIVNGDLDVTGATLSVIPTGGGFTAGATYVIAKYTGTRTGEFASVTSGYALSYDDEAKEITITYDGSEPQPTAYDTFIANSGLTGDDAATDADPDNDGFSNLLEFVLASDPTSASLADAPTSTVDTEGNLVFIFRRNSDSTYVNPGVEYSTSLTGEWTAADSATVTVETNGFASGVDKVTVTLPASLADGGKLFARLTATL